MVDRSYVSYGVLIPLLVAMFSAGVFGLWKMSDNTVTFREYERWVDAQGKRSDRLELKIDEILRHLRSRND